MGKKGKKRGDENKDPPAQPVSAPPGKEPGIVSKIIRVFSQRYIEENKKSFRDQDQNKNNANNDDDDDDDDDGLETMKRVKIPCEKGNLPTHHVPFFSAQNEESIKAELRNCLQRSARKSSSSAPRNKKRAKKKNNNANIGEKNDNDKPNDSNNADDNNNKLSDSDRIARIEPYLNPDYFGGIRDDSGNVFFDPRLAFLVTSFLTASECELVIRCAEENIGFGTAEHAESNEFALRRNKRSSFISPGLASMLFNRAANFLPPVVIAGEGRYRAVRRPLKCNDHIRIYRYDAGDSFGRHIDEAVEVPRGSSYNNGIDPLQEKDRWRGIFSGFSNDHHDAIDDPSKILGVFTLLIYLNDVHSGGETTFYDNSGRVSGKIPPRQGTALFHAQGDLCADHEGSKVEHGAKYCLRSDVLYIEL